MSQKIIISLLVCAVAVPVVVYSAPNRNTAEVAAHRTEEDVLAVTNLPSFTVRPSNELEHNEGYEQENAPSSRTKRAIIFRPLFVYRQQEIKKQKLREMREQQQQQPQRQQSAASAACQQQQQHQQASRKPVRYYAQYYPYQRL
ncbi:probable serine/threonine-protein kinase fhkB [Anopheles merus]|uniref:probable serine/threonine-protein kinase fhkB n=1 Tax=Anopheles merus TaxID=30066 RepID=UPI001BE41900|nr:probable serine/threonine-protein kinase fhkB [Anopheles merus]